MKAAASVSILAALFALGSCGSRQVDTLDESTLDDIRLMLDSRICGRNMDDLSFTIVYAVLGYDSAAVYEVPAGTPDSLLSCPVTGLRYEVSVDSTGVSITCPSGHGSVEEQYR